ncbi:TIGR02147 family protein [Halobacteriovorax sp. GB3]|uniref:TIGR02147 family protein n=1 Tax=Halobacteriovorax sp. GB3 TaxID=2719615 RepID=UPI00235FA912|nr:TIGR02147 family protein [Halobacteriovorax sp. GB3]MDD0854022.1 TIGR02147 family protein [Halobacteriovorax sp. GB3]
MIPSVVDYLDYREYLKDFYEAKKAMKSDYSYRVFTNRGDLKSPSHLKMIIDGKRNLTTKTIPKYVKALGLTSKKETKFFELLVQYTQEKDMSEKKELFCHLMDEKKKKGLTLIENAQFQFFANWYNVVIYVLLDIADFEGANENLLKLFKGEVSMKMAKESFTILRTLGLIERNNEGYWKQSKGALSTSEDIRDMALLEYHSTMIKLGLTSLRRDAMSEREFNGATLQINKENLPEVKKMIRDFRKEINQYTSSLDNCDQVYQLNIQFFPLTEQII